MATIIIPNSEWVYLLHTRSSSSLLQPHTTVDKLISSETRYDSRSFMTDAPLGFFVCVFFFKVNAVAEAYNLDWGHDTEGWILLTLFLE